MTPFQLALSKGRDRYNTRFALARYRSRDLSAADFLAHLRDRVGPVVDAAGVDADPVPLTDALVELSLRLAERGWLAEGTPTALAFAALPSVARAAGAAPDRVPAALLTAARHVAAAPVGDVAGWLAAVAEVAAVVPPAEVDLLLGAAAVAAWRHGVALLRRSAVDTMRALPTEVLVRALGSPVSADGVDRMAADPWAAPVGGEPGLLLRGRVGAFTGFGGQFPRPPVVRAVGGRWYAESAGAAWEVAADRYGWDLRQVAAVPEPDGTAVPPVSPVRLGAAGEVTDGRGGVLRLPELADATSVAGVGDTLAITTRYSHRIVFVGRSS
ncbi:hypothetical protein [Actinokineospora bangkokensis]|uniref:hypothetical protein n=1 Tax=Actinokineospora bangkokensis TaxID=1193682 RepID=UPI000AA296D6|nr:hypothetical protein [Actinokineospora bangkokensis]